MTHPDYRGQGIFPALARRVHKHMREQDNVIHLQFSRIASLTKPYIEKLGRVDIYEIPFFRLSLSE